MLRVLIADDEMNICKLIEHLVDWKQLDLKLIGMVNTGVEAVEFITREKPEIVITDIRMPGYDGLDLIRRIREVGLDTKFIIISGYRHFEYAHTAISYGVSDYLLKPIVKDDIMASLAKIVDDINKTENKEDKSEKIETAIVSNGNSDERNIVERSFIMGDITAEILKNNYGIDWTDCIIHAIAARIDRANPLKNENKVTEQKVIEYLIKNTKDNKKKCSVHIKDEYILALMPIKKDEKKPDFKSLLEGCKAVCKPYEESIVTFGVSSGEEEPISEILNKAMMAVRQRIFLGTDRIIEFEEKFYDWKDAGSVISIETRQKFMNNLQIFSVDAVNFAIGLCFSELKEKKNIAADTVFDVVRFLTGSLNNTISSLDADRRKYIDRNQIMIVTLRCKDLNEIEEVIKDSFKDKINEIVSFIKKMENRPVRITKQYIQNNYMEQISLNDVANQVHLNSVYLSVLFKKETGENFKDYLTNYRIEVAKNLLKTTGDGLSSIAEQVGYKDTKYFSKLFNKVVGINPTKYRKLYR